MKQIQLPQGMQDLFPEDCREKERLRSVFLDVFRRYGYRQIETPLIEYYATYQNAYEELEETKMYKLTSSEGKVMTLRGDMTLPIARLCVTKFNTTKPPYRFAYCGDVYQINESFAGKRNAVTDCGIELVGMDECGDLEVLCCALDALEASGCEGYILEIGTSAVFLMACREAGIDEETGKELAGLIDRKAIPDIEKMVKGLGLKTKQELFFQKLALMSGINVFARTEELCFSDSLLQEIRKLEHLKTMLEELGYGEHVRFDLGKAAQLDYYTGIIFQAYVNGAGTAVLSGGRYDDLLNKLGRPLPAIGFSIKLDYLLDAVKTEKKEIRKLFFRKDDLVSAMRMAKEMQKDGPVELMPEEGGE